MKTLDQMAIQEFGIPSLLLMENAGRGVADLICGEVHDIKPKALNILAFCGKGNNGGDGLVACRYLANRGFNVRVLLFTNPSALKDDPAVNYNIVNRMKVPAETILDRIEAARAKPHLIHADMIIDALFGVGLNTELTDVFADAIGMINESGKKVIAVDLPSGLNADTGEVMGVAVKANITATLGLPKKGLYEREGPFYAGDIQVIDIGLPAKIL
ncbi:MAG TPA: NAD(P)H-hydrate epimerase [bacterium]|nr:NAD(P)H-hydrate epimerase [bacterium]